MANRRVVTVKAKLRGQDHEVECKVKGTRISRPGDAVFEMADLTVHDLPEGLPDGIYQLEYEGSGERIRKTGSRWELEPF